MALVFALIAILGFIAAQAPATSDWANWVVPLVVIAGAVGTTQIYPDRARVASAIICV